MPSTDLHTTSTAYGKEGRGRLVEADVQHQQVLTSPDAEGQGGQLVVVQPGQQGEATTQTRELLKHHRGSSLKKRRWLDPQGPGGGAYQPPDWTSWCQKKTLIQVG